MEERERDGGKGEKGEGEIEEGEEEELNGGQSTATLATEDKHKLPVTHYYRGV